MRRDEGIGWALAGALVIGGIAGLVGCIIHPALSLAALPAGVLTWFLWRRKAARREKILQAPFPPAWRELLERQVAYYRRLPPEERLRFEGEVAIFLAEQRLTGIKGVEITDEVRILVAASAVILLFGRRGWRWPRIDNILIYPDLFTEDYKISRRKGTMSGMVHPWGTVIFALPELRQSFEGEGDGFHVGLHEFAHILDLGSEGCDGVPQGVPADQMSAWYELMKREMERVHARRSMLDDYAGTDESELFAVAVETFFERPREMAGRHPELHRALSQFFAQDPSPGHEGR